MQINQESYQVLLVEDEAGDAFLIKKMLEDTCLKSFKTTWVSTMEEAKKNLAQQVFHLVLLDLSLPDSTGLKTVKMCCQAALNMPVVVLTGHDDEETALEALDVGAQDYLVKGSFDAEALVRALRYALARSRSEEELRRSEEKFRSVIHSMDDVLWIASFPQGEISFMSPVAKTLFGCCPQKILSQPDLWFHRIHPADKKQKERAMARFYKEEEMDLQYRIIREDGQIRWIRDRSQVIFNSEHNPLRMYGFLSDITDNVLAQEKIQLYTKELELKNRETQKLYQQLDENLDKARQIHEGIFPKTLPEVENLVFSTYYNPAQKMGGDFYYVLKEGQKLILYLSDVMGHGLEGALLSLFVKHTIETYISLSSYQEITPAKILEFVAKQYKKQNYPPDYFICLYIGVLDLDTMIFTYIGSGFQVFPLVRWATGEVGNLKSKGLFISSIIPLEELSLREYKVSLSPGTTILFTTDGLVEQEVGGRRFDKELKAIFKETAHLPAEFCLSRIIEGFRLFNQGSTQGDDDLTILILQVNPLGSKKTTLEYHSFLGELSFLQDRVTSLLPETKNKEMFFFCLQELVANAMEHGNRFHPDKKVIIDLLVGNYYLLAAVKDEGDGFNWREKINTPLNLEGGEERGRGLSMTQLLSHSFCYNEEGNKAFICYKE